MITNDEELDATLDRIRHFQAQIRHLRKVETNPTNYRLFGVWIHRGGGPNAT
jgi:hypothetical protein